MDNHDDQLTQLKSLKAALIEKFNAASPGTAPQFAAVLLDLFERISALENPAPVHEPDPVRENPLEELRRMREARKAVGNAP